MGVVIVPLQQQHWPAVRRIYQEGIETGQATFEVSPPDWPGFDENHTADCRLVAVEEDRVYGWAALSPFSRRPVYQGVAEASVSVERSRQGKGLGTQLLENLIRESERRQYWTLLAKIFPENEPSLGLARRLGRSSPRLRAGND